jgi:hypothetical protein
MVSPNKNFIFNFMEKKIRGSFVNLFITLTITILIAFGAFITSVALNLKTMESLIIGFFGISFGVWAGKKAFEKKKEETKENVD